MFSPKYYNYFHLFYSDYLFFPVFDLFFYQSYTLIFNERKYILLS